MSESPVIRVDHLFGLTADLDAIAWQPFRDGIEIHLLYGDLKTGPAAALLRYAAGSKLPAHTHGGYEHIIVLRGAQRDANGDWPAGAMAINQPGSSHAVTSDGGCIALAIWQAPVQFE